MSSVDELYIKIRGNNKPAEAGWYYRYRNNDIELISIGYAGPSNNLGRKAIAVVSLTSKYSRAFCGSHTP